MKKVTAWCIATLAVVVLCLAATDKTLPSLPLGTGPVDSDLLYLVSGGVDHRILFSQVRTALNSTLFAGTTTNLTNYSALTLPNASTTNWGYPLLIDTYGRIRKGTGLMMTYKFYSGNGFSGDGASLYNLDGANFIDGSLSGAKWQWEDAHKFFAGEGDTPTHKPIFRYIVSNDIPQSIIGVPQLAQDVLDLMNTSTNGVTNVFNANMNNVYMTNATNWATFTLANTNGTDFIKMSAGSGLEIPNGNVTAGQFTGPLVGDGTGITNGHPNIATNGATATDADVLTKTGTHLKFETRLSNTQVTNAAAQQANIATNALGTAAFTATSAYDAAGTALAATNGLGTAAHTATSAYDAAGTALAATNGLGTAAFTASTAYLGASATAVAADRVVLVAAPSAWNDPGIPGQMAYSGGKIYLCIATNSWVRGDLVAW